MAVLRYLKSAVRDGACFLDYVCRMAGFGNLYPLMVVMTSDGVSSGRESVFQVAARRYDGGRGDGWVFGYISSGLDEEGLGSVLDLQVPEIYDDPRLAETKGFSTMDVPLFEVSVRKFELPKKL